MSQQPTWQEATRILQRRWGDRIVGQKQDMLDAMFAELQTRGWERAAAETALAEMQERGRLRYIGSDPGSVAAMEAGITYQSGVGPVTLPSAGHPAETGYWAVEGDEDA